MASRVLEISGPHMHSSAAACSSGSLVYDPATLPPTTKVALRMPYERHSRDYLDEVQRWIGLLPDVPLKTIMEPEACELLVWVKFCSTVRLTTEELVPAGFEDYRQLAGGCEAPFKRLARRSVQACSTMG